MELYVSYTDNSVKWMDNSPETGFLILILITLKQHNLVPNV